MLMEKEYFEMAYVFVTENEIKRYRKRCSEILQKVCRTLKKKGVSATFVLVGSGAKNMVTRNGDGPYDLDYNLFIQKADESYRHDLRALKNEVRLALNKAAGGQCFDDSQDSTSCLTAILHFNDSPKVQFSFDVAIVRKSDDGSLQRLKHIKNPFGFDQHIWNTVPDSREVRERVEYIKKAGRWKDVRDTYISKKNMYLSRQDKDHPSFVVYIESVNEVYMKITNHGLQMLSMYKRL